MRSRSRACCFLFPSSIGIYLALIEQLVAGITLGAVSLATPKIVGAVTPSFASLVFAIVCFVAAGVQILGFIGVVKEKPVLFRRYISFHAIVTLAAFALGATWAGLSAGRHSTAKDNCIKDFYDVTDTTQKSQADIVCEIFPWVDVGIMGGLWVLFAIMHIYLFVFISSYSRNQVEDRAKYDALADNGESTAMTSRNWDKEPTNGYVPRHTANAASAASMSDVMAQPLQRESDSYSYQQAYDPYAPTQPSHAYTSEPQPTPKFNDTAYGGAPSSVSRPSQAQAHPAEGSFHRKGPKVERDNSYPY